MQDEIVPYRPDRDSDAVYALWQSVMGKDFPLSRNSARKAFDTNPAYSYSSIALRGGEIVGFISAHRRQQSAALQSLFVAPAHQHQGIGTALHNTLLKRLAQEGVTQLQLGGGEPRLFPGVPVHYGQAGRFFKAQGWEYNELSLDMIQPLEEYFTASGILEKIAPHGIRLELCDGEIAVYDMFTFVSREFPSWFGAFQIIVTAGDLQDILLAVDSESQIVGCLVMYGDWSHPSRADALWQGIWGNTLGALGAVGTAESRRGLGIGSALVAYGTQLLKERGASHSFIGWTWAESFYERLGYHVWQTYQMSWRKLT